MLALVCTEKRAYGELAGHGHCGDLMAAPGADAYEESVQQPGRFGCRPRRLDQHGERVTSADLAILLMRP